MMAEIHDDHGRSVVELCGGNWQWFAKLVVIDEEAAEERRIHLELSGLSLDRLERI